MSKASLDAKIAEFRKLHEHGGLLLNNCWDVFTAKIAESVGAKALATTSAGVAWSHGVPDGHHATRNLVLQGAAAIVAQTALPVTVDIEDGFVSQGDSKTAVVTALMEAGVAGVNIEDSQDGRLLSIEGGVARLKAFRAVASSMSYSLFINARIDAMLRQECNDSAALIERANAYLAAGADCIFIPGLTDLTLCRLISSSISGPLNTMSLPGSPTAAQFFEAGVARVSAGSFHAESAYGHVLTQMRHFQESGMLDPSEHHLGYVDANALSHGEHS
ncbi:isocitrate lyase/PEP mutase family protein [Burkholderia ubonensis]|uniref:isocitrate lyase/PEP mutase family protein n=1 Tax=Burkholderia ubonensis TaxID=101571 RepID=UPI0015C7909F|nr:isocitrate lyase/phosphoenolpyruvate mutase family protein [Burkholderia ubonensis]